MRSILFVTVLLLISCSAFAQTETGFVPLFNGTNLDGWTATTENENSFFVEDGELVLKGGRAHLFYSGSVGDANFKNFEYKLKIKTVNNSNSGVYFHTQYQEEGWPAKGFEAQVNSSHTDPRKTGSLYGIVNIFCPGSDVEPYVGRVEKNKEVFLYKKKAPSKDKKWFDYHITVIDNTITIRVNGEIQTQWTQPDDWANPDRRIGSGTMALQAHDPECEVRYKDIRIKILD